MATSNWAAEARMRYGNNKKILDQLRKLQIISGTEIRDEDAEDDPESEKIRKLLNFETLHHYLTIKTGNLRLLRVMQPGRPSVMMYGEMRATKPPFAVLEEVPLGSRRYIALSYAWGKDVTTRMMYLDGGEYAVAEHVWDVINSTFHLPLISNQKSLQRFWIDAMCIDQADDEEKEEQVRRMADIYGQATLVLVWLGSEADNSELAMDNIRRATWFIAKRSNVMGQFSHLDNPETQQEPPPQVWWAIGRLFRRPWFNRMWVIQELLVGPTVAIACGPSAVKLWAFADLARALPMDGPAPWSTEDSDETKEKIAGAIENFNHLMELRRNGPIINGLSSDDFAELLHRSRFREVTLPVDRVWSLLGVLHSSVRDALYPDYSAEGRRNYLIAYLKFMRVFLPTDTRLTFFSYISCVEPSPGMPCWCPDFNVKPLFRESLLLPHKRQYHAGFNADDESRSHQQHIKFPPCTTSLVLHGFCVDVVDRIISPNLEDLSLSGVWEWEAQCLQLAQDTYKTFNQVPEAHWRTLIADHYPSSPDLREWKRCGAEVETWYSKFKRLTLEVKTVEYRDQAMSNLLDMENFHTRLYSNAAMRYIHWYRYFSTRNGRVGLAPNNLKPGDEICVFPGARTAHIVRFNWNTGRRVPRKTSGRLIGDAYVHGLMYGEALSMGLQPEVIRLE
jgi:hypothetical protein